MGASTAVLDPPVSAGRRPRRRSARITTPLVAGLGTAAAVAAHWRSAADGGQAWLELAVGLLLGAVAAAARPTSGRSAAWACAAGIAWLVGPAVPPALWLHRPLLVALVLSFPVGRLASAAILPQGR